MAKYSQQYHPYRSLFWAAQGCVVHPVCARKWVGVAEGHGGWMGSPSLNSVSKTSTEQRWTGHWVGIQKHLLGLQGWKQEEPALAGVKLRRNVKGSKGVSTGTSAAVLSCASENRLTIGWWLADHNPEAVSHQAGLQGWLSLLGKYWKPRFHLAWHFEIRGKTAGNLQGSQERQGELRPGAPRNAGFVFSLWKLYLFYGNWRTWPVIFILQMTSLTCCCFYFFNEVLKKHLSIKSGH